MNRRTESRILCPLAFLRKGWGENYPYIDISFFVVVFYNRGKQFRPRSEASHFAYQTASFSLKS